MRSSSWKEYQKMKVYPQALGCLRIFARIPLTTKNSISIKVRSENPFDSRSLLRKTLALIVLDVHVAKMMSDLR